ncbi:MAG: hypothetical protein AB8B51_21685 [Sedimentitalea sp.]
MKPLETNQQPQGIPRGGQYDLGLFSSIKSFRLWLWFCGLARADTPPEFDWWQSLRWRAEQNGASNFSLPFSLGSIARCQQSETVKPGGRRMNAKWNCYDNPMMETVLQSIKAKLIRRTCWATIRRAALIR